MYSSFDMLTVWVVINDVTAFRVKGFYAYILGTSQKIEIGLKSFVDEYFFEFIL